MPEDWLRRDDTRIDFPHVELEYLPLVSGAHPRNSVDVTLGVIEVMPRLGIDAADGTHHLGPEQNVVDRHDLQEKLYPGIVIHARVEEDVVANQVDERWSLHVLRESTVAPPVIGDGPAAVGNDEAQGWKVPEQIPREKLHERGRVGVQVVRTCRVKVRVARGAHVH